MKRSLFIKCLIYSIIVQFFIYSVSYALMDDPAQQGYSLTLTQSADISAPQEVAPLASEQKIADWTFFLYVQSKNDLHPFSVKNLQDIAKSGSNERINIIVQWEELYKTGTWRYKINKNNIELIEHTPLDNHHDCVARFTDATQFAFSKYPSRHTALIFWGHGYGVIDPSAWWNHIIRTAACKEGVNNKFEEMRSILFNYEHRVYMTNQQMLQALEYTTRSVLSGKKLDVIGMDSCLMAMFETAYQTRNHANYLISSQQVEHAFGWPYDPIFSQITAFSPTPLEYACVAVEKFGDFYRDKVPWYTQSAMDLTRIEELKENLDHIVRGLLQCKAKDQEGFRSFISNVRRSCLQFNVPSYIDLYDFYDRVQSTIISLKSQKSPIVPEIEDPLRLIILQDQNEYDDERRPHPHNKIHSVPLSLALVGMQEIDQLLVHLENGMKLMKEIVVANATGHSMQRARGISIYFPHHFHYIDHSYAKTEFAQHSLWLQFLHEVL